MPPDHTQPQITDMGPRTQPTSGPFDSLHDAPCTECERPIGETGRWYPDGTSGLLPYCKPCAEIEFPVI